MLLFECSRKKDNMFTQNAKGDLRFFESEDIPYEGKKTLVSALIMIAMIVLSTLNVFTLLQACFLAAGAMLITRCCTPQQASESINWNILMVFAGSVCLGTAIDRTGNATALANGILGVCGDVLPHSLPDSGVA